MDLVGLRYCLPAEKCRKKVKKSVLCPVLVAPNTVLVPPCCYAVVCPLPRDQPWGTLVSQPPGGTRSL